MTDRRPPKKWEVWGAGFAFVIWIGNAVSDSEVDAEGQAFLDWLLILTVVWFISIVFRKSKAKVSIASEKTPSLPPPSPPVSSNGHQRSAYLDDSPPQNTDNTSSSQSNEN